MGLAGVLGTALAACSSRSSGGSSTGSKKTPLNAAKFTSFVTGNWNLTMTQDFHDGSTPKPISGTIEITADRWTLVLGHGLEPGATPTNFSLDGNASGTWQATTDAVTITPGYGNGPEFGDHGAPWWSTLTASGLSSSPHSGQQLGLPWNPTLSGNDPDMFANPGTLAVHIKSSRLATITHTMNPPSDPQTVELDKTTTTITATKR